MKPPLRTKSVGTKVSEAEFALLEERARGAGMRLAEWVREALLLGQRVVEWPRPFRGSRAESSRCSPYPCLQRRMTKMHRLYSSGKATMQPGPCYEDVEDRQGHDGN